MCTGWSAIKISKSDEMSPGTERQILNHNNYGYRLGCDGFKPTR